MISATDTSGTIHGFKKALAHVAEQESVAATLVFCCDQNGFTPARINPLLRAAKKPLFGGIFPAVLAGHEKLDQGTLVVGLPVLPRIQLVQGLSVTNRDYETLLEQGLARARTRELLFVLVDGLAQRISAFMASLFHLFGLQHNYIGGGAGSLSLKQKPCIISNQGLIQDAAVLAAIPVYSGIGVNHGWQSISGPYRITQASRNIIHTIDWQPAYQVYKHIVDQHATCKMRLDNFFDLAKAYPFGIVKIDGERIVRDPIEVAGNQAIRCVGEVPEGSFVDVLKGRPQELVKAAAHARLIAESALPAGKGERFCLFMDCVSRVLFLGKRFDQEIQAVFREGEPLFGACTIGEIANSGREYLEFFNKTAVVAIIESP